MNHKTSLIVMASVASLLASVLVIVPFVDFYQNLYAWHFKRPAFVQGSVELLAIWTLLFASSFYLKKKYWLALLIFFSELYLRRLNIDLTLGVAFLFADSLTGLGYFFQNIFKRETLSKKTNIAFKLPLNFVVGACLFVMISMGLSLIWFATMKVLLVFSTFVLILFYLTAYRESLLCWIVKYFSLLNDGGHFDRLLKILLYVCVLMIAGKASGGLGCDEVWYSVRLNECLNMNGSHFENLKMFEHWVHQYPKFFEIMAFPLQWFDSFTVTRMLSLVTLLFVLIASNEFLAEYSLCGWQKSLSAITLISIPAVATSVLAKPDMFAGFVFLLSVLFFIKGFKDKDSGLMFIGAAILGLTLAIKLVAVVYVPVFFVIYAVGFMISKANLAPPKKVQVAICLLLFFTVIIVTLRTYIITGVPFVSVGDNFQLVGTIYKHLGMEFKFPFGNFMGRHLGKINSFILLRDALLFPSSHLFMAVSWLSNIALPFMLMALLWLIRKREGELEGLLVLISGMIIFGIIAFVLNTREMDGGPGIYHLMPILVVVVVGSCAYKWLAGQTLAIALLCSIYVIGNLPLALVQSISWHVGTRQFDLDFTRSPFDKETVRNNILQKNGLLDVKAYFDGLDPKTCLAVGEGPNIPLNVLGCRMETSKCIYGRNLAATPEMLSRFLREKGVTHLLVPNYFPNNHFGRFCEKIKTISVAETVQFKNYTVIDIRRIERDQLLQAARSADFKKKSIMVHRESLQAIRNLNAASRSTPLVDFNPRLNGVMKFYQTANGLISIKPDTSIEFVVNPFKKGPRSFEACFASNIYGVQDMPKERFHVTIKDVSGVLAEDNFIFDSRNYIDCIMPLGVLSRPITITIEYVSDNKRPNLNIPGFIIQMRLVEDEI
jgi:hypothetical protein